MHTDIDLGSLIFKAAPARLHPYIRLARLDRPTGTWLLLLPCWWSLLLARGGIGGMGAEGWGQAALFALGALLMRSAGCVINDLQDRDLDAGVERTRSRPLPSGEVSQKQALVFLAGLLLPAFLVLLCLGKAATVLGLAAVPLVVLYPRMKRVTWWPQAFLGLTFNWGALMGFAATDGKIPGAALLLYAGGIFWTLAYDTIYAHQDIEDDARLGIRSTARLFGGRSRDFVAGFYALAWIFIVAAKVAAAPGVLMILLSLPSAFLAWWTLARWSPSDPASSLAAFREARWFGWLVLAMAAL